MAKASSRFSTLVLGLGTGAGLMYFLDPARGRRRRARVGEWAGHLARAGGDGLSHATRHALDRANGTLAKARAALGNFPVSDVVLEARARARLGRLVSHPHALRVQAINGRLRVSGRILAREVAGLHAGLFAVAGVTHVDDDLDVHSGDGRQPLTARDPRDDIGWSPEEGATMHGEIGFYRRLKVDAALDKVFAFWKNLEALPHFLSHVEDVKPLGDGRHHWIIRLGDGSALEWDTETTRELPNQLLSWRSVADAPVQQTGMIHVEPDPSGGTRMHVRFTYRYPQIEGLFGANPVDTFEEDCARIDEFIERGVPPMDTAERPAFGI